jgi:hypothetical protein
MTGTTAGPDLTASQKVAGLGALALATLTLRCLPLRVTLAAATAIGCLGIRSATEVAAVDAVTSCRWAARWYPGRAACLETSLAAFIALALRGYRADWCIGCRLGPAEAHAWICIASGPVGERDQPGRSLHATVRI